ncbi:hypothetical protein CDAR_483461 [Caerostris darwini]|uniref:Uncharacterized protein n=1 Tax=Caerostris darwini TaxID=1538125 RepID=A0AAV4SIP6_9ARAC|nr:hypothetical protein CDAR_483461 [Caerostris darwini]
MPKNKENTFNENEKSLNIENEEEPFSNENKELVLNENEEKLSNEIDKEPVIQKAEKTFKINPITLAESVARNEPLQSSPLARRLPRNEKGIPVAALAVLGFRLLRRMGETEMSLKHFLKFFVFALSHRAFGGWPLFLRRKTGVPVLLSMKGVSAEDIRRLIIETYKRGFINIKVT